MQDLSNPVTIALLGVAGIAVVCLVAFRVGYALFAYGVALGLPDLAIPLGGFTRLRLDDIVVVVLCLLLPLMPRTPLPAQNKLLLHWLIYASLCLASLLTVLGLGHQAGWSTVLKFVGTLALLVALVKCVSTPDRLRWLCKGLFVGATLLVIQLVFRYQEIIAETTFTRYSAFKGAMSFDTWNPNTIALFAIPFSFGAYLGYCLHQPKPTRVLWLIGAAVFAAIPVFILARGPSIAMFSGWMTCLLLMRTVRLSLLLPVAGMLAFAYGWLFVYSPSLGESAMAIDIDTGRGFSGRYEMWATAWDLFLERPLLGAGFSREPLLFRAEIGKGMAHSQYFTVLVELGLLGFAVYVHAIGRTVWGIWSIPVSSQQIRAVRSVLAGLAVALIVVGVAQSGIGWIKPGMLGVSLIIIGISLAMPRSAQPPAALQANK